MAADNSSITDKKPTTGPAAADPVTSSNAPPADAGDPYRGSGV